jgi:hypothetical protein
MVDEQVIYPTEALAQQVYDVVRWHLKPGLTLDAPTPVPDGTWMLRLYGQAVEVATPVCLDCGGPSDGGLCEICTQTAEPRRGETSDGVALASCGHWLSSARDDAPPCMQCDLCERCCECLCEDHGAPLHAGDGCDGCLAEWAGEVRR